MQNNSVVFSIIRETNSNFAPDFKKLEKRLTKCARAQPAEYASNFFVSLGPDAIFNYLIKTKKR